MELMASLLLEHPICGRSESIDNPKLTDRDVRQEAAVRVIRNLSKRGVPMETTSDLVTAFEANGGLIRTSLNSVVRDSLRKSRGYKQEPRPKTVSMTNMHDNDSLADPTAAAALEAVEGSAESELEAFFKSANSAEQEAVLAMKHAQWYTEQGLSLPSALRSKLKRLRKQTGLALDVSLL